VDRTLLLLVGGIIFLANFKRIAKWALTAPWRLTWRLATRRRSQ